MELGHICTRVVKPPISGLHDRLRQYTEVVVEVNAAYSRSRPASAQYSIVSVGLDSRMRLKNSCRRHTGVDHVNVERDCGENSSLTVPR